MSLGAYFLNGVSDESILVFRTSDQEDIIRIITRLKASRDKEIRALAEALELMWFERQYTKETTNDNETRRISGGTRSKNRQARKNGSGN
jgi:hypothetical protein